MSNQTTDYGTVTYNNHTFILTAQAYFSNRVFPLWWGVASFGPAKSHPGMS